MSKKPYNGKIRVVDKLRDLIPPLDEEQLAGLEQSLVDEGGAYNPLWLWGDVLVDGHHRYKLCKKNKLPFDVKQVYETAETIEEVEYRMKRDAIYQRNLTASVQSRLRAEMVAYQESIGHSKSDAVAIVAKEAKVSERQVYRDVEKTELINKLDDQVKEAAESLPTTKIKELAKLPKAEQRAVAKKAEKSGKKLSEEMPKPKATPEDEAKKVKSLADQYRAKLVRAIDDYHYHKPNARERDRLVKVAQSVKLWS
jgi:hypothetical protein